MKRIILSSIALLAIVLSHADNKYVNGVYITQKTTKAFTVKERPNFVLGNGKADLYLNYKVPGTDAVDSTIDLSTQAITIRFEQMPNIGNPTLSNDTTIADYNLIKNYILTPNEMPKSNSRVYLSADTNQDNVIDASDCENVSYFIYQAAAKKSRSYLAGKEAVNIVNDFNYSLNGTQLTITTNNASDFLACQMDIQLPKNITVKTKNTDNEHMIDMSTLPNGNTRLLVTSIGTKTFNSNDVINLTLSNNVSDNTNIDIENAIFTNTGFQSIKAALPGAVTGIEAQSVNSDVENGKYAEDSNVIIIKNGKKYNTAGQRVK